MNEQPKTAVIQFRATPAETWALKELACQAGLSYSETMRKLIREAAEMAGLPPLGTIREYEVEDAKPQS
jgi:hypothetical protein